MGPFWCVFDKRPVQLCRSLPGNRTTDTGQILKLNFHFVEVAGLPGYVGWWLKGVFLFLFFKCIVYLDTVAIEAVDFCFISLNSQCTVKEKKNYD